MPPPRPAALYLHVPFCRSKCGYCDFYSLPRPEPAAMEAYPEAVLAELEELLRAYDAGTFGCPGDLGWDGSFDTLFIGGGTPTLLPPAALGRLLAGLRGRLAVGGEWTVECNPESLGNAQLELFEAYGVTRISLGVQSLEEEALRAAGRPCSREEVEAAIELLGSRWKGDWSGDLIVGLPGQSRSGPERDASRLFRAGASHLSLYSLTLEEGTPFFERAARRAKGFLPEGEEAEESWFEAARALEGLGFERYEVSNFALPGKECRHNLHYWRIDPYLGAGPGAVSTFLLPEGRSLRRSVKKDLAAYLGAASAGSFESLAEYEEVDGRKGLEDYLLMSLRTKEGAKAEVLEGRFRLDWRRSREAIRGIQGLGGLLILDHEGARASPEGLDFLDSTLLRLFEALDGLV